MRDCQAAWFSDTGQGLVVQRVGWGVWGMQTRTLRPSGRSGPCRRDHSRTAWRVDRIGDSHGAKEEDVEDTARNDGLRS